MRRASMAIPPENSSVPKDVLRTKEQPASKDEPALPSAAEDIEQIIFTMRAATGEVVKVEKMDAGGNRHAASKEEIAGLVGHNEVKAIEEALDEAFEAGISSLLDPENELDESPE